MKKILIVIIGLNMLLVVVLAGLFVLTETYPLRPGGPLYSVQHTAEQWRLRLGSDEARRAVYALELAERRLGDVAGAEEAERIDAAVVAFDRALNEAVMRIGAVPAGLQEDLDDRLETLLGRAEVVVTALDAAGDPTAVIVLERKLQALQKAETPQEKVVLVPQSTLAQAETIPFLSEDVDHDIYPLTGEHAEIECEACHPDGEYAGTPTGCAECHELPADYYYLTHFSGDCAECHVTDNWYPFQFDHVEVAECQSCHLEDTPTGHYARSESYWRLVSQLPPGAMYPASGALANNGYDDPCATCHLSTEEWGEIVFDHYGYSDCESCHEAETPEGHYEGACADCHGTETWDTVLYEHAGVVECRTCHLEDSPADHYVRADSSLFYVAWALEGMVTPRGRPSTVKTYPDTCANCHKDVEDWQTVAFDHRGFANCLSCHLEEDTPEDHYAGQCSSCHDIYDWEHIVAFDHSGYDDCQDCHELEEAHYAGQCSNCHNIYDWEEAVFDHTGFAECVECHGDEIEADHYMGACASCHSTEAWDDILFDHSGYVQCTTCHQPPGPDHYHLKCASCHSTDDWGEHWFNHSGYNDCASCHGDDAPAGHYGDGCAKCHEISGWQPVGLDHTNLLNCVSCHQPPADHYGSICTRCHNTDSWQTDTFSHVGLTDCQACHAPPPGHDHGGQCSNCHTVDNWGSLEFSHVGLTDCQSCHQAPVGHYPGQCDECHDVEGWSQAAFSHDGLLDCESCHLPPAGHWPGQCSSCHGTSSWGDYTFNHDGYTNCNACHSQDRPASHSRGQCSKCHTTAGWSVLLPTGTPLPTNTPLPPTITPTNTPVPPTPTSTPVVIPPTNTPTNTPVPPTPTHTPIPPTPTPVPPTPTPITPTPTPIFGGSG